MSNKQRIAIQLRYLQTLLEIGGATNSTTMVFPAPIDLIQPLLQKASGEKHVPRPTPPPDGKAT